PLTRPSVLLTLRAPVPRALKLPPHTSAHTTASPPATNSRSRQNLALPTSSTTPPPATLPRYTPPAPAANLRIAHATAANNAPPLARSSPGSPAHPETTSRGPTTSPLASSTETNPPPQPDSARSD